MKEVTETVLNHHLQAFLDKNITEIMKDYTEASKLWTPDGRIKGLSAIQRFFTEVFKLFPDGIKLEMKQQITEQDKAYIAWSADSFVATIPLGTDTFVINDSKIVLQTLAAQIVMKQPNNKQ